jgi:hypothetical protein
VVVNTHEGGGGVPRPGQQMGPERQPGLDALIGMTVDGAATKMSLDENSR